MTFPTIVAVVTWQHDLAAELTERAAELRGVERLRVFGSVSEGDVDRWSDLDVAVELSEELALTELVPGFELWAYEEQVDLQQVLRLFGTDGRHLDLVVSGARLRLAAPPDPMANEVRFALALATIKLGRDDRLIATHLALGVARSVLVEAMMLRDADRRTTVHRCGSERDVACDEVLAVLTPPLTPTALRASADVFDLLHGERVPHYRPDWRGLDALGGD